MILIIILKSTIYQNGCSQEFFMKQFTLAVDGPAGSGKSTVTKEVAQACSLIYVDSGSVYRTVTYMALTSNYSISDPKLLTDISKRIKFSNKNSKFNVVLDDKILKDEIRTIEVSKNVPVYSANKNIRNIITPMLQEFSKSCEIVMDGRDIGTVVLPHATVKIFLTASVEERARRRFEDFQAKGEKISFEEVLKDVQSRDFQDENREIAPLKKAEDAIILDTTEMKFNEVIDAMTKIVRENKN